MKLCVAKICLIPILLYGLLMIGCNSEKLPGDIISALDSAGENRPQLLRVINHYKEDKKDSLKLKAAFFLIKNLTGRYYYSGDLLNEYQNYTKLISLDRTKGHKILTSIEKNYGKFSIEKLKTNRDLEHITADQFINDIDIAFKAWEEMPWSKNYSFKQFCEFILPFRIADEVPEYNRKDIYLQYRPLLDSVIKNKLTAKEACRILNANLKQIPWVFTNKVGFLPHFPSSKLIKYRAGTCQEMSDLAIFVMRSTGIPVGSDFAPQWAYRGSGHNWNVVLNENGTILMFLGAEDNPGTPHRALTKKGKIFRNTFAINPKSLGNISRKEDFIPGFLKDPRIIDVTDQYGRTFSVQMTINNTELGKYGKFAYLSLYNKYTWKQVDWSYVKNGVVNYNKVEGDIVYMITKFDQSGTHSFSAPFLLDKTGKILKLIPDSVNTISRMVCRKIFPNLQDNFAVDDQKGGKFQGANNKDFRDAEDLYTFPDRAMPFWNQIDIKTSKSFRYYRYISSPDYGCHVAELKLNSAQGKVAAVAFAPLETYDSGVTPTAVADNIFSTYYSSNGKGNWVALDCGKKINVESFSFYPKMNVSEDTNIKDGHKYELSVFDEGKWNPINCRIAKNGEVIFTNIPSNGLYIIKDLTEAYTNRIFTFEKNCQFWR